MLNFTNSIKAKNKEISIFLALLLF